MRKNCKHFDTCSATLCPMEPEKCEYGIWYPDEEICRLRSIKAPWIRKQKKIVKRGASFDKGYFTVKKLNSLKYIRKAVHGANPDASWQFKKGMK